METGDLLTGNREMTPSLVVWDPTPLQGLVQTPLSLRAVFNRQISGYLGDIGSFDLPIPLDSKPYAVANGRELDFVLAKVVSIQLSLAQLCEEITGASTTLSAATNVLKIPTQPVSNAGEVRNSWGGRGYHILWCSRNYDAFPALSGFRYKYIRSSCTKLVLVAPQQ